ncbi:uncharacterized protein LOC62_07G009085 [Vanrija pseudolonga]|uniref:Uncharacterized protein n=1 Tax=Vanrija pseudolonga TaxID=143232 RepID=A0AAF0YK71_9TREE|nr:hypothetical protein LOC62_07G009085 [Vanrija pseudolonga]
MVGDITPPSSNANTPLRAPISPSPERVAASSMDVDTGGPSTDASPAALEGDDDVELGAASSSTDIEDADEEDAPKDTKKPGAGGSGKPGNPRAAFRPKEKELYEADIVERWNKSFGDPFQPKSGAPTPSS